jgi:hypothetical protein
MDVVTGKWSLFHDKAESSLVPGFTDRVDISPVFLESSLTVVFVLLAVALALLVLFAVRKYSQKAAEEGRSKKDKERLLSLLGTAIAVLYRWLAFPVTAGFWLVLSLAGYLGNLRLPVTHEGLFASAAASSLAMLLVWALAEVVFFFEGCHSKAAHPLSGEKEVSDWYIPFFLFRITALSVLLQAGVFSSFSAVAYPIFGVELIYFIGLLFRCSYKSLINRICSAVVEMASLCALVLALIRKIDSPT